MPVRKYAPVSTEHQKFPREAMEDYAVVDKKDIQEWRESLAKRFGIGQGKMTVVDDLADA